MYTVRYYDGGQLRIRKFRKLANANDFAQRVLGGVVLARTG